MVLHQCISIKLTKTCKNCRSTYISTDNNILSCRVHKGRFIGAEASKHSGTRSGGDNKGLLVFWDCCDAYDPLAPGCCSYYHVSYDDDDDSNKSYLINNYNLSK